MERPSSYVIDVQQLPSSFPTHLHPPEFWTALGRAVATFGFLEETLSKAIFSFTATRPYEEREINAAFEAWVPKLVRTLSDQLGGLINSYETAVKEHLGATLANLSELTADMRKAAVIRNVICHGSWSPPDRDGFSLPLFINRKQEIFRTPINVDYLEMVQLHATELACAVINSVTHMGWQFPGSGGPGEPVVSLGNSKGTGGSMKSVSAGIERKSD